MFKIPSVTIVIKSLIEKINKFYFELSLNSCLYELNHRLIQGPYKTMVSINIKDPPFTSHSRFANIFDFNPKKLSIEKVTGTVDDELEYIYYVKYDEDPFYLVINDLKGYFRYYKEKDRKKLEFIMKDKRQAEIYNQIWDKIKKLINNVDGVNFEFSDHFRDRGVIRPNTDDTLPLDDIVNVYSMTIVIRSIYRTYYNRFYPQIHLADCIYKEC